MVAVSAIVVNFNGGLLLRNCIRSLAAALAHAGLASEILIVDNASTDGSITALEGRHKVLHMPNNRGFAAGVEAALSIAKGEWILLLNNDAVIEADAVDHLVRAAATSLDVGAVAPQMRFDRPWSHIINSAGIEVDRLGVALDRCVGRLASGCGGEPAPVFGASGGAALYRRSMIDDVGGFDPSFFMYLEDADLAWRAQMRGWKALYVPRAVVYHKHSATAIHQSSFKYYYVGRNRVRMLAKNADKQMLVRNLWLIVLYDLGYVVFVAVTQRNLAPLRGRLSGIRMWRTDRMAGARCRAPVALAPAAGIRAALRRNKTWAGLSTEPRAMRARP